jgi:hypothetical protein
MVLLLSLMPQRGRHCGNVAPRQRGFKRDDNEAAFIGGLVFPVLALFDISFLNFYAAR